VAAGQHASARVCETSLDWPDERRRLPLLSRRPTVLDAQSRDVDRTWRLRYCVWELTLRCDLACNHRGSRAGRARANELTTAEALNAVDQLADLGVLEVTLFGAEVYLRDGARTTPAAGRRRQLQLRGRLPRRLLVDS
jgi:hypothetical protein